MRPSKLPLVSAATAPTDAASTTSPLPPPGGGVYAALALLAETADEVLLGTVRDVHVAVAKRVYGATGGSAKVSQRIHKSVATAIYGGLGTGLRATGERLRKADRRSAGPRI